MCPEADFGRRWPKAACASAWAGADGAIIACQLHRLELRRSSSDSSPLRELFGQLFGPRGRLPGRVDVGAAKMAVDGGLAEQRTTQVELLDDAERAQIEELAHGARDRRVRNLAGAERIDADRDRLHASGRVRDLHLAARRHPGAADILAALARARGARPAPLRRGLTPATA